MAQTGQQVQDHAEQSGAYGLQRSHAGTGNLTVKDLASESMIDTSFRFCLFGPFVFFCRFL